MSYLPVSKIFIIVPNMLEISLLLQFFNLSAADFNANLSFLNSLGRYKGNLISSAASLLVEESRAIFT